MKLIGNNIFKLLFVVFFLKHFAVAAPVPSVPLAVTESMMQNLFLKKQGVELSLTSRWQPANQPSDNTLQALRYRFDARPDVASLSLRIENIRPKVTIEKHLKKWMKEYAAYGFEVLSQQKLTLDGSESLVVDLVSREKQKQIRQVLIRKDQKLAVFTCLDDKSTFNSLVPHCGAAIKSFKWTR